MASLNLCHSSGGRKHTLPRKVIQPRCKLLLCAKMHFIKSSILSVYVCPSLKTALSRFSPLYSLVLHVSIVTQVQIAQEVRPILK